MISISVNARDLVKLSAGKMTPAMKRALKKAGATALRDMRSEASKRIRKRKRLKAKYIREAITLARPKGGNIDGWKWAVNLSGKPVPLIAYPHRQTPRPVGPQKRKRRAGGVYVQVNQGGGRTLVKGAFLATMASGHQGIFQRMGKRRLPIRELFGSRPVDALLHKGEAEAIAARGASSLSATFARLLPLEMDKG